MYFPDKNGKFPKGDIYVKNKGYEVHVKLNSGKAVIYGNGDSALIDNPEAFKGWID